MSQKINFLAKFRPFRNTSKNCSNHIWCIILLAITGQKCRLLLGRGGGIFSYGSAPLPNEPVLQYRFVNLPKTDDNDRTHGNDNNALSWYTVNASFWARECLIGPIQLNCFALGYSRKKPKQRGGGGVTFLKKSCEFFCFSLYHWKFQLKQSSSPGNLVKFSMRKFQA